MNTFHRGVLVSTLVGLSVLVGSCGDDDDGGSDDRSEVERTVRQLAATGPEDVDYLLAHATDKFLEEFAGYNREDCAKPENVDDCVGEPSENVRVDNVVVAGDDAEADLVLIEGEDEFVLHLTLIKEDGTWKADTAAIPQVEIPEEVKAVEVAGAEYEFQFDETEITDGNIAFAFANEGEQDHELLVYKVVDDFDVESVFGFGQGREEEGAHSEEEELPPGAKALAGATFAAPGDSGNVVFGDKLEAGRYAMLCFFQNDDGTPHVDLGMHAEFTIGE